MLKLELDPIRAIKSTDEISRLLCLQAIKDKAPVLESKGGQIVTKVLSSVFKGGMNIVGVGDTGFERIVELIPNYDNNGDDTITDAKR